MDLQQRGNTQKTKEELIKEIGQLYQKFQQVKEFYQAKAGKGAIKSAVFSIIRCIIAYLSVRVVSLKEKQKVIISARSYN